MKQNDLFLSLLNSFDSLYSLTERPRMLFLVRGGAHNNPKVPKSFPTIFKYAACNKDDTNTSIHSCILTSRFPKIYIWQFSSQLFHQLLIFVSFQELLDSNAAPLNNKAFMLSIDQAVKLLKFLYYCSEKKCLYTFRSVRMVHSRSFKGH